MHISQEWEISVLEHRCFSLPELKKEEHSNYINLFCCLEQTVVCSKPFATLRGWQEFFSGLSFCFGCVRFSDSVPSCSLARTRVAEDDGTLIYISSKSHISLGSVLAFARPHCLLWKAALCLRTTWKLATFADRVRRLSQNPHSKHRNMLSQSKYAYD